LQRARALAGDEVDQRPPEGVLGEVGLPVLGGQAGEALVGPDDPVARVDRV